MSVGVLGNLLRRKPGHLSLLSPSSLLDWGRDCGDCNRLFNHEEVGHIQGSQELEAWVPDTFTEEPCRPRPPPSGLPLNETNKLISDSNCCRFGFLRYMQTSLITMDTKLNAY